MNYANLTPQIRQLCETRIQYLSQIKQQLLKELKNTPDGSLRICRSNKRVQFYHCTDPKNAAGKYIRKKDFQLVQSLAQKDYELKLLASINEELNYLTLYLTLCLHDLRKPSPEQIYPMLHPDRKALILPLIETDEQYISNWLSVPYHGKAFSEDTPELYTAKGERVRSKSEMIIADMLSREKIPYRYEYPLILPGIGKIYPDFTVLNISSREEFIWEHFGLMDDPGYAEKAIQKINAYEQAGYFPGENLIVSYETRQNPINQKLISNIIKKYLL